MRWVSPSYPWVLFCLGPFLGPYTVRFGFKNKKKVWFGLVCYRVLLGFRVFKWEDGRLLQRFTLSFLVVVVVVVVVCSTRKGITGWRYPKARL